MYIQLMRACKCIYELGTISPKCIYYNCAYDCTLQPTVFELFKEYCVTYLTLYNYFRRSITYIYISNIYIYIYIYIYINYALRKKMNRLKFSHRDFILTIILYGVCVCVRQKFIIYFLILILKFNI